MRRKQQSSPDHPIHAGQRRQPASAAHRAAQSDLRRPEILSTIHMVRTPGMILIFCVVSSLQIFRESA